MSNAAILPPRPLSLRTKYVLRSTIGGFIAIAAGLAAIVGVAMWQWGEAKAILADNEVWSHGVVASDGKAEGSEKSHWFIFNEYRLKVDYVDDKGQPHHSNAEFDTFLGSLDSKQDLEIRFDPKAPEHYALSWAINAGWSRWASVGFLVLVLSGLSGLLVWVGFMGFRRLGDARACAASSEEIELEVLSVGPVLYNGRDTGSRNYKYRVDSDRSFEQVFRKNQAPLYTDSSQKFMVGLRSSAGERPTVLHEDFYPYALSEEQKQVARMNIERRSRSLKTS
jgi:hypothetical protein